MFKIGRSLGIVALVVLGASCTPRASNEADPKQRLTDYIAISFSAKKEADREKLLDYLSGGAKNRLISWSDEQFKQAFVDSKRQFVKLAIREIKNISPTEANVTYELTYMDQTKGADARVTNKRMCEMVLDSGKWTIREVHNIKELIEYKNEMSLP